MSRAEISLGIWFSPTNILSAHPNRERLAEAELSQDSLDFPTPSTGDQRRRNLNAVQGPYEFHHSRDLLIRCCLFSDLERLQDRCSLWLA